MHRVLSYQTAVQANNERDIREYVTKRTCVSLILSIAFFTLISGFLLGKFVTNRQNHIKQLEQSEHEILSKVQDVKSTLLETALESATFHGQSKEMQDDINHILYRRYQSCLKERKVNFNNTLNEFVDALVHGETIHHLNCLINLNDYLEHHSSSSSKP